MRALQRLQVPSEVRLAPPPQGPRAHQSLVTVPLTPEIQLAVGQAVLQQHVDLAANVNALQKQLLACRMERGLFREEMAVLQKRNEELQATCDKLQKDDPRNMRQQEQISSLQTAMRSSQAEASEKIANLEARNVKLNAALLSTEASSKASLEAQRKELTESKMAYEATTAGLQREHTVCPTPSKLSRPPVTDQS